VTNFKKYLENIQKTKYFESDSMSGVFDLEERSRVRRENLYNSPDSSFGDNEFRNMGSDYLMFLLEEVKKNINNYNKKQDKENVKLFTDIYNKLNALKIENTVPKGKI
jgi:hypothetical protein